MKKPLIVAFLAIFLIGCSRSATSANQLSSTPTPVSPPATPTAIPTATPTPVPTPTPLQDIGGVNFTGYWLKVIKTFDENGSQSMKLMYQDGYTLTEVATFCVRVGDTNTPDGFYYIVVDRGTTYPTARGYSTVFFSHNFGWKLALRSWYLHPAPWNDQGVGACPVKGSGGCVNKRPGDFDIILEGGEYTNPTTGKVSKIPNLGVGTPFIIVQNDAVCTYLGQCLTTYDCETGRDCFRKYSCQYCADWGTKWEGLLVAAPNLNILDTRN